MTYFSCLISNYFDGLSIFSQWSIVAYSATMGVPQTGNDVTIASLYLDFIYLSLSVEFVFVCDSSTLFLLVQWMRCILWCLLCEPRQAGKRSHWKFLFPLQNLKDFVTARRKVNWLHYQKRTFFCAREVKAQESTNEGGWPLHLWDKMRLLLRIYVWPITWSKQPNPLGRIRCWSFLWDRKSSILTIEQIIITMPAAQNSLLLRINVILT